MVESRTAEASIAHFGVSEWVLFVAVSLIWGASFLFIANGLEAFHPMLVGSMRIGFGMLTLSCIPAARGRIERADRPRIMLLGLIWMAVPLTLFPYAEQRINSSVAGMLNGGMPILVAVAAVTLYRRHPSRRQIGGLLLGLIGIVFVGLPSLGKGSSSALGVGLVVLALFGYAFSTNLSVPLTQKYGSLLTQRSVQTTAFFYTIPFGLFGLRSSHFEAGAFFSVLTLGVAGTGLAFVMAGRLIARVGPTRGTVFTYVMPVVSLGLGVLFRDDHVAVLALCGIPLVLAGEFIVSRSAA